VNLVSANGGKHFYDSFIGVAAGCLDQNLAPDVEGRMKLVERRLTRQQPFTGAFE
jgi:hypothetical protein